MIDNEHNESLRKRLNQIQREHLEHTYGKKDAMYEGTKEPRYGSGTPKEAEEQADTERSRLEESFGAGATTKYIKQIPKLDGAGKPNMEMDIAIDNNIPANENKIKRGQRIPKNTFGRIQQAVISGGSKKEKHDLVDVIINKLMSNTGKKNKEKNEENNEELEAEVKGSGWNHAIKEIEEVGQAGGAKPKPKPVKKDIRLGRGAPEEGQKPDKRKSRAQAIKKIMSEKGLKMIEASKYIKEHNIAY